QWLCGASKKNTLLDADAVFKGPYVATKAGDLEKLKLTLERTKLFLQLGVRTPTVELQREQEHPDNWWLVFQQLASIPKADWKTTTATDGKTPIIERVSTGLLRNLFLCIL